MSSGNGAWLHTVFLIVLMTVALIILSTFGSLHTVFLSQRSLFDVALHFVRVTVVENKLLICALCHEEICLRVSDQVRTKPGCTATEDG